MLASESTLKTALFVLAMAAILLVSVGCSNAPKLPDSVVATPFKSLDINHQHTWNKKVAFPFTGGAAIDIDGDGKMEIFVSGGHEQEDALYSYREGAMDNIIAGTNLSSLTASYGATAIDFNDDGQTDLLVARDDGVWLHTNNDGVFDAEKIAYESADTESTLAVAVSDFDQDGDIDLYLSNFIAYGSWVSSTFNKPEHVRHNRLLRNDGGMNFTDITQSSGTAGTQNTFLSVFTDLDQDGYQDLVLSNNTGTIEILHNNRDSTFDKNVYDSGIGYWMGLGVGDYDADGDQDLAISNVSNSIPTSFLRGDLTDDQTLVREWVLLRNDGDRKFTDIAKTSGLTGQGFGWGMVFEDLNLDGSLDLLAAQNYIKWPVHKINPLSGRAMLQVNDENGRRFINAPVLNLEDRHFGQSAIVADLDGDARQDVVWVNMNGPVIASLNEHTNRVVTLAVPENVKWIGARVTAVSNTGNSYTREVTNAIGMQTDQSPHLSFAVPTDGSIDSLQVEFADGTKTTIEPVSEGLVLP